MILFFGSSFFTQVTFTPRIPENASSSFSIIIGRNVSNLKISQIVK